MIKAMMNDYAGAFGMIFGYTGDDGKPVKRTKQTNPYNYDDYVLWDDGSGRGDPKTKVDRRDGAYSDRMMQWDYDKFNRCCQEIFGNQGQYFNNREPAEIEKFLRKYFGKPNLVLVRILESCNQATGYPLWYFRWIEVELTPEMEAEYKANRTIAEFFTD